MPRIHRQVAGSFRLDLNLNCANPDSSVVTLPFRRHTDRLQSLPVLSPRSGVPSNSVARTCPSRASPAKIFSAGMTSSANAGFTISRRTDRTGGNFRIAAFNHKFPVVSGVSVSQEISPLKNPFHPVSRERRRNFFFKCI